MSSVQVMPIESHSFLGIALTPISDNMRKFFIRWLTAARKARHRRLQLQEREEEFKLMTNAAAFDKWRERYMDIRLQPLVRLTASNDCVVVTTHYG